MSLPGPLSLPPIQAQDLTNLNLQSQERISAEVLQVAGDRVYLAINGVQVVARLTSSDQASRLMERRQANFIVKDSSQKEILLQLVGTQSSQESSPANSVGIIPELLKNVGLDPDPENVLLAQELLKHNLPIKRRVILEIRNYFQTHFENPPTSSEISTAVALLAKGLPLSPGSLALMTQDISPLGEILQTLIKQLQKKARSAKPSLSYLYTEAAGKLTDLFIPAGDNFTALMAHLQRSLPLLANSLEGQLLDWIKDTEEQGADLPPVNNSTLSLAALLGILDQEEPENSTLYQLSSKLMNRLRQTLLSNLAGSENIPQAQWLQVELPIILPDGSNQPLSTPALLKMHTRQPSSTPGDETETIHFNLTIQLEPEEFIRAEFVIQNKQIRGEISSSTPEIQQLADQELPELETQLSEHGFTVQQMKCQMDAEIAIQSELSPAASQNEQIPHHLTWKKLNLEA